MEAKMNLAADIKSSDDSGNEASEAGKTSYDRTKISENAAMLPQIFQKLELTADEK